MAGEDDLSGRLSRSQCRQKPGAEKPMNEGGLLELASRQPKSWPREIMCVLTGGKGQVRSDRKISARRDGDPDHRSRRNLDQTGSHFGELLANSYTRSGLKTDKVSLEPLSNGGKRPFPCSSGKIRARTYVTVTGMNKRVNRQKMADRSRVKDR